MGGHHGQDGPRFCSCARKKFFSLRTWKFFFCSTHAIQKEGRKWGRTGAILVKDGGLGNMRRAKGEPVCALQNWAEHPQTVLPAIVFWLPQFFLHLQLNREGGADFWKGQRSVQLWATRIYRRQIKHTAYPTKEGIAQMAPWFSNRPHTFLPALGKKGSVGENRIHLWLEAL